MTPPARARLRELGIAPGLLPPGPRNDITDVAGVRVGHVTLSEGARIRTGATAVLPHGANLFLTPVVGAFAVANGFGKAVGVTQINELGSIETPIVLTNTLAVPAAMRAVIDWTLAQPGNERVVSVNAVVAETNDGRLNDIRAMALSADFVREAIERATDTPVVQGCVGAGTGTVAFGIKGGIGSSSRQTPAGHRVGVLIQSNFGGDLVIDGLPVGRRLVPPSSSTTVDEADGSIVIVLATDAPLNASTLGRLARRTFAGLARTGSSFAHGSGDYAIAFAVPIDGDAASPARSELSALFLAAIEATEEAIYESLTQAVTTEGFDCARQGHRRVEALPLQLLSDLQQARVS